jgi:hypothetical protein
MQAQGSLAVNIFWLVWIDDIIDFFNRLAALNLSVVQTAALQHYTLFIAGHRDRQDRTER